MKRLIYNIGILADIHPRERLRLEGEEMNEMGIIHNAYLLINDEGRIEAFGHAEDRSSLSDEDIQMIDAEGGCVLLEGHIKGDSRYRKIGIYIIFKIIYVRVCGMGHEIVADSLVTEHNALGLSGGA